MADHPVSFGERSPSRLARRTLTFLLLLLLLIPLIRLAAFQGWVRPVRIAGGSMAGSFHGPHCAVRCADCGIVFRCGAEYIPTNQMAVCPNCGFARNYLESASHAVGKRVVIDRWSRWMHGPRPWQPVAFASARRPDFLVIKRLVARGSGTLEIRDGDIFVDGEIQQKTLDQLRQLRILVHDDRYRPTRTNGLPDRWRGSQAHSRWRTTSSGYMCATGLREPEPTIDWLEYIQWACWPNPSPPATRTGPAAILDHYAYNQNVSRSGLHQVGDVMLLCKMSVSGTGWVVLRCDDGADCFELELAYPDPYCRLRHNGEAVWHARRPSPRQPWSIEFAVCDQRVLATINGTSLLEYGYQPAPRPRCKVSSPLALGVAGLRIQVDSPRIYRDVYYLGPAGERQWVAPQPLEPNQWFVIGDNVPISIDSRHNGPCDGHAIIGPVYRLAN